MKTTKSDFTFLPSGYGRYDVTYQSPVTGKKWRAMVYDMEMIDNTRNEEYPKQKDLDALKRYCKSHDIMF
jgi:hypothetical protein